MDICGTQSSLVFVSSDSIILYPTLPSAPHGVEVCVFTLPETEDELLSRLPADYAKGLQLDMEGRLHSKYRRMEWLASRVMLHQVCPGARIAYHSTGRPYLAKVPEKCSLTEISISHSHHIVVLCRANRRVGIDYEIWSERALRIMPKYLTPEEQDMVTDEMTVLPESRMAILLWTAKEAAYKYFDAPQSSLTDLHISELIPIDNNAWQAEVEIQSHARAFLYIYGMRDGALSICMDLSRKECIS